MTRRVVLRPPVEGDRAEFIGRLADSVALHDPWVEPVEPDQWFDRLLARNAHPWERPLLVCVGAMPATRSTARSSG